MKVLAGLIAPRVEGRGDAVGAPRTTVGVAAAEFGAPAFAKAEAGEGVDEARRDPLAAGVDAAGALRNGDAGAHGRDLTITDEDGPVLDLGAADRVDGAAGDGDHLRAGERGEHRGDRGDRGDAENGE